MLRTAKLVTCKMLASPWRPVAALLFLTMGQSAESFVPRRSPPLTTAHPHHRKEKHRSDHGEFGSQPTVLLAAKALPVEENLASYQKTKIKQKGLPLTTVAEVPMVEADAPPLVRELVADDLPSQKDNLFAVLESMLHVSSMCYTLGALRKYAREHDKPKRKLWPFWKIQTAVDLRREELILDDDASDKETGNKVLKKIIKATDVADFIRANLEVLEDSPDVDINTSEEAYFNVFDVLARLAKSDADLVEFDDAYQETELVYGVAVNRDEKRVTVIFRGSVVGGKDWRTNFNAFKTTLDVPPSMEQMGYDDEIRVHRGFKAYLFDETQRGDDERGPQKFDEIVNDILDVYSNDEYKDFDLYVTGHSLGGALCTLAAFKLAASRKLNDVRKPITAVSLASPFVGDDGFNNAFQFLERNGKLRHLRVSNEKDAVTVSLSLGGYTHSGINLHLSEEGVEFGYRNLKSFWSQARLSSGTRHGLMDYWERLKLDEVKLRGTSIDELYGDESLVGDFRD